LTDYTGLPNIVAGDVLEPSSSALIVDYECEAAVTKGQAVYLSSDGKVSPATSAQNCMGIATKTGAVGDKIGVVVRGRVKVAVGGAITRNSRVYGGDASGRVLALADQAVDEGGTAKYSIYYSRGFARAEQSASSAGDLISIIAGV
jgi:hypothetical protein